MRKASVRKIDATKREITIEASGDLVKNKFEEVYKSLAQTAKVPGFRQGHVPRDILEKKYSSLVHEQVVRELIPDVYKDTVTQENLDVVEQPDISEVKIDSTRLSFKATVNVSPEINVKQYRGIKITYKKPDVTEDDVKRGLDALKEARKAEALDDGFARSLGYPDLAALREGLSRQIYVRKQSEERQKAEAEIIGKITKDVTVALPASLIQRQCADMLRQQRIDLAMKGVSVQILDEKAQDMQKELEPQAREQVKLYLVLAAIAKKEHIAQDDHMAQKVLEFLFQEAEWNVV
jgi:trigger factor